MKYKLSPSSLNIFKDCPRCFWLIKNKIWKRPDTIFPSLPSGMDKVLKEHFDRFRDKNKLPPEIKQIKAELFKDKELLKIWRSNFKGIQYTDKQGNIIHGAVDNILIKNNKLIVLDYKTRGYPLKEDTHEHYQTQMDLYNFLLRKNNYKTENYSYLLFYYPNKVKKTGEVIFDTKLIKLTTSAEKGEAVFKKAIKLLNSKIPEERCDWCKLIEI